MNIVLVEPDIPWNTGNVGRTCVGTESTLHLVGRLGFSLKDKYLKRAGLDYWQNLDLKVYEDWEDFTGKVGDDIGKFSFFEKDAPRDYWEAEFTPESYLIFGSETRGFSPEITRRYSSSFYRIPMTGQIRSLNLSTAVAVAVYEAFRQTSELVTGRKS